ncbi:MAG: HrcA family transcriptional regulator [Wolinella sp.]
MKPNKLLLLDEIIREYLKQQEPIGSESLRLILGMKISSATIRNHFKTLVKEGVLHQPHISSGRIPTELALKNYWRERLLPLGMPEFDNISSVQRSAERAGVFCILRFYTPNFLQGISTIGSRYLVLEFNNGEVLLHYSSAMERFLSELIGLEIRDIYKMAKQLCVRELSKHIAQLIDEEPLYTFNLRTLAMLLPQNSSGERLFSEISSGLWLDTISDGLFFEGVVPSGNLTLIQPATIGKNSARLMVVGALNRDYEAFYQEALA